MLRSRHVAMGQNGMQQTKSRFLASKQHASSTPRLGKIDCSNLSAHLLCIADSSFKLGIRGSEGWACGGIRDPCRHSLSKSSNGGMRWVHLGMVNMFTLGLHGFRKGLAYSLSCRNHSSFQQCEDIPLGLLQIQVINQCASVNDRH